MHQQCFGSVTLTQWNQDRLQHRISCAFGSRTPPLRGRQSCTAKPQPPDRIQPETLRNSASFLCSAATAAPHTADLSSGNAVEVRNLSHRFGDKQVLRGANLSIPRGTLHILAGANGCGKSTVLRILGRLLQRQSGDVSIDGPLGIVLQNPDHQIVMPTVAADVAFGLGRYRLSQAAVARLVRDALQAVDLLDCAHRSTNTLSGGQKQRAAIAGALAQNPKVLLLDELTTFLDDEGQRSVLDAVRSVVDGPRRVTALWVTHRLEELQWADSASFIEGGQVRLTGSPQEVLRHMKSLGAHI